MSALVFQALRVLRSDPRTVLWGAYLGSGALAAATAVCLGATYVLTAREDVRAVGAAFLAMFLIGALSVALIGTGVLRLLRRRLATSRVVSAVGAVDRTPQDVAPQH